jgi:serine/threonine-protein kinase
MAKRGRSRRARPKPPEESAAPEARPEPPDEGARPRPGALGAAIALAVVHALWALFQWGQLMVARGGGDAFCGLDGSDACASIWDSPFATAVQDWTSLPVAGWGLAWSLVAFALALGALVRRARGRAPEPVWTAAVLTALAGLAGVLVLAAASVAFGELCSTCAVTYVLVIGYAAICLREAGRLRSAGVLRGGALAVGATLVAFLGLLYPGLRTPHTASDAGRALLERAAHRAPEPPEPESASPADGGPRGVSLDRMIADLARPHRQVLSDLIGLYAESGAVPLRPARSLLGSAAAPVRITEFTDVLCGHCAELHHTLEMLGELVPTGSFSIEPRQFPLDSACNPELTHAAATPVSCLAARAQICLEGSPRAFDFAGALFENGRDLTAEKVFQIGARFVARESLEACVAAPETEAKLQDDIAWAAEHEIQGTPLVLVNGRKGAAFGPFLLAMVLSEGSPQHPAFESLPPPRPPPIAE